MGQLAQTLYNESVDFLVKLLTPKKPSQDERILAAYLLSHFKNIYKILQASPRILLSFQGMTEDYVIALKSHYVLQYRMMRNQFESIPLSVYNNSFQRYCIFTMGGLTEEILKIFYLDQNAHLITDDVVEAGTARRCFIDPAELTYRLRYNKTSSFIMVHNHPSGSIEPTFQDIEVTHMFYNYMNSISIELKGHLIIGGDHCLILPERLYKTSKEEFNRPLVTSFVETFKAL